MISLGEIIALDRTVLTERVAKLSGAKVELLLSRLDVDTRSAGTLETLSKPSQSFSDLTRGYCAVAQHDAGVGRWADGE